MKKLILCAGILSILVFSIGSCDSGSSGDPEDNFHSTEIILYEFSHNTNQGVTAITKCPESVTAILEGVHVKLKSEKPGSGEVKVSLSSGGFGKAQITVEPDGTIIVGEISTEPLISFVSTTKAFYPSVPEALVWSIISSSNNSVISITEGLRSHKPGRAQVTLKVLSWVDGHGEGEQSIFTDVIIVTVEGEIMLDPSSSSVIYLTDY